MRRGAAERDPTSRYAPPPMRRAFVAGVLALAVLGLGTPPLGAAPPPDVQAIVISGLLRPGDFPAGWTTTKPGVPPNYSKLGAACRPLAAALAPRVDRASSRGFLHGGAERADNSVVLFPSPKEAGALFTVLQNPAIVTCYRRSAAVSAAEDAAKSGVQLRVLSVAPISVAPVGDQSIGVEAVLRASAKGQSQLIYEDNVAVRVGRAAISFSFVTTNSSPNGAFAAQMQAAVSRARAAE